MHSIDAQFQHEPFATRTSVPSNRSNGHRRGNAEVVALVLVMVVLLAGLAAYFLLRPGSAPSVVSPTTSGAAPTVPGALGPVELVDADVPRLEEVRDRAPLLAADAARGEPVAKEAQAPGAAAAQLVGRVVDDNGRPVEGAQVELAAGQWLFTSSLGGGQRELSGADGRFAFDRAPQGDARLTVAADGYATTRRDDIAFAAGGVYDLGDIALERAVVLMGRVVDVRGLGIEGARLSSESTRDRGDMTFIAFGMDSDTLVAETGPDGAFEVTTLPAGPWRLSAAHDDHPQRRFEGVTARPGDVVRDLRFELPDGAVIAGTVVGTDRRPGKYSVQARGSGDNSPRVVLAGGESLGGSARTVDVEANGAFRIAGLEPDTEYELVALRNQSDGSGVVFYGFGQQNRVSDPVRVRSGTLDARVEVLPSGRLRLSVVDALTNEPIEEFGVRYGAPWDPRPLRQDDGSLRRQHPGGVAEFGDLPLVQAMPFEGGPVVRIDAAGYIAHQLSVEPPGAGQTTELGRIALTRAPMALITVTGPAGPVAGAEVTIGRVTSHGMEVDGAVGAVTMSVAFSSSGSADGPVFDDGGRARGRTDEQGHVAITMPIVRGEVELRVRHGDFAPYVALADVTEGADLVHTVVLGPGAVVNVRVEDSTGAAVPWVGVEHRAPGDRGHVGDNAPRTDAEGVVRFERLAAGTHRFRVQPKATRGGLFLLGQSDSGDWTDVVVADGDTLDVLLEYSVGVRVHGIVREDGNPLPAARVTLQQRGRRDGGDGGSSIVLRAGLELGDEDPVFMGLGDSGLSARTDGEGRYAIEGVQPGEYELRVTHTTRAAPTTVDVVVTASGDVQLDVDLSRNGVRGVVRDEDGEPVPGLSVHAALRGGSSGVEAMELMISTSDGGMGMASMNERARRAVTDENGRFELDGLPTKTELVVKVAASRGAPYTMDSSSAPFTVGDSEWKEGVDVVVRRGGAIEVLIGDGQKEDFGFATVQAVQLDASGADVPGSNEFGFIDEGRSELRGVAAGRWRVTVQAFNEEPPIVRDVEVVAGEKTTIDI